MPPTAWPPSPLDRRTAPGCHAHPGAPGREHVLPIQPRRVDPTRWVPSQSPILNLQSPSGGLHNTATMAETYRGSGFSIRCVPPLLGSAGRRVPPLLSSAISTDSPSSTYHSANLLLRFALGGQIVVLEVVIRGSFRCRCGSSGNELLNPARDSNVCAPAGA